MSSTDIRHNAALKIATLQGRLDSFVVRSRSASAKTAVSRAWAHLDEGLHLTRVRKVRSAIHSLSAARVDLIEALRTTSTYDGCSTLVRLIEDVVAIQKILEDAQMALHEEGLLGPDGDAVPWA